MGEKAAPGTQKVMVENLSLSGTLPDPQQAIGSPVIRAPSRPPAQATCSGRATAEAGAPVLEHAGHVSGPSDQRLLFGAPQSAGCRLPLVA